MLESDSEDDFEGYVDEEEYAERYEYSDIENNSNSENECEMEEDICGTASDDEMEIENETLDDSKDSEDSCSSSASSGSNISATPGPSFTATPGPTQDMTNKNPLDFFRLLIPDSILEEIVKQTHLYAEQIFEENDLPPRSRAQMWDSSQHDLSELKKFLCLIIVMESIHYPAVEDYWSISWPFASSTFSSIMKRDRFSLVLKFLYLNDNSHFIPKGQPGHDPLHKIRPFLNKFWIIFSLVFSLEEKYRWMSQ